MKAFVSWSGGKDCTLALYKFMQANPEAEVAALLNMNRVVKHNAHRLSGELLQAQAQAMGIKLNRVDVDDNFDYSHNFQAAVNRLKEEEGIDCGIFGDIYLEPHLDWVREQCRQLGITPIFPLLNIDVHQLYSDFVEAGFKSKVVAVKLTHPLQSLLGQDLSMENYAEMIKIEGFDVCGELGEFHSFVYDGPIFSEPVKWRIESEFKSEKHHGYNMDVER